MAEKLRSEISGINNNNVSKLKSKFISLCNKSCQKDLGRADLINNISRINLSFVETEAPSFGLKFATTIKNEDMGKLINTITNTMTLIATKNSYKVSSPLSLIAIPMN